MKLKDLIFPFTLAVLTTWTVQYFFMPKEKSAVPTAGAEFVAPTTPAAIQPLQLEVDFHDAKVTRLVVVTEVDTPTSTWKFTNDGGSVEYLAFKKLLAGKPGILEAIMPSAQKDRSAFLIALNGLGGTPYYYELVEHKKEADQTIIVYKAETDKAVIRKQFTVPHTGYTMQLSLTIEPKNASNPVQPRILFPAPYIQDTTASDINTAVIFTDRLSLIKKNIAQIEQRGWAYPVLFGAEDRYFACMLINDKQKFVQRGYFKPEGTERLSVILEGPQITEKQTWEFVFFCGPKESQVLNAVDPRLEGLLDYGWLAPISKPLLYILNYVYSYAQNYGLAIIILTFILKLLMVPLALKGESSARKGMELQRRLQYLEARYRHEPDILAREKEELIRKHGASMLGCLPLLLQIPVFIGLNRVLSNALELYKAPFLWIPDLSAKDPYYILPILVGIGMIVQTAYTNVGGARQRLTNVLLAVIITGVTSSLSAGLTLFIAVSTWLGIAQSHIQKAFKINA
jgi:YidC/Oxa1 family membrane protein insertase